MKPCDNIYLVGMMGAGKTTAGRQLARRLKKNFFDCDYEIEARTGVRIPVIFEIEGEPSFRRREAEMLRELTGTRGVLLATGGGVVLDPANRAYLAQTGLVVYFNVEPAELFERTRRCHNRPLLQVVNPQEKINELYAQRDPLYREIADMVIEGVGCTPAQVARLLEEEIGKRCKP